MSQLLGLNPPLAAGVGASTNEGVPPFVTYPVTELGALTYTNNLNMGPQSALLAHLGVPATAATAGATDSCSRKDMSAAAAMPASATLLMGALGVGMSHSGAAGGGANQPLGQLDLAVSGTAGLNNSLNSLGGLNLMQIAGLASMPGFLPLRDEGAGGGGGATCSSAESLASDSSVLAHTSTDGGVAAESTVGGKGGGSVGETESGLVPGLSALTAN